MATDRIANAAPGKSGPVEIEVRAVEFRASRCRTRLPFRFGRVTLTEAPVLVARVRAHLDGQEVVGHSADLCVPKWFEKDPAKSIHADVTTLFRSAERAGRQALGRAGTVFSVWHAIWEACVQGPAASGVRLVDGFGVALVERAMIDAACRGTAQGFADLLATDGAGFDAATLHPTLTGDPLARSAALVASPRPRQVLVRHTVGGLDPLRSTDVTEAQRGRDGHPVALEEDIAAFGLRAFKLKAGGDPEQDLHRLAEIGRVVEGAGVSDPIYTLDANESYASAEAVGALLDRLAGDPDGRRLLDRLHYLEQPLPRAQTLDPSTADGIRALATQVPLLIDEADDAIDAFERALSIGYRGVSVKNCKGVFRALGNRALVLATGAGAFQTSEDLTNLPVLPLQQDLATVAALGLPHSERNGHHFFPGLDVVPDAEAESARTCHPDLYRRQARTGTGAGDRRITLSIQDGALSLACQEAKGFGSDAEIAFDARAPLEDILAEPFS